MELEKLRIAIQRLGSRGISDLIPRIGYSRDERNQYLKRVAHLIRTLQNNSIPTIASLVSPYRESRQIVRDMVSNTIDVYVATDPGRCIQRDSHGGYQLTHTDKTPHLTGISGD